MSEEIETLQHPVFGKLEGKKYRSWKGRMVLPSGREVRVEIYRDDESDLTSLQEAARLYEVAIPAERSSLREATEQEFLSLYNDTWRESIPDGWETPPVLSAEEFMDRLTLTDISFGCYWPVEFWYDDDDMFGGHGLVVRLDKTGAYTDSSLEG